MSELDDLTHIEITSDANSQYKIGTIIIVSSTGLFSFNVDQSISGASGLIPKGSYRILSESEVSDFYSGWEPTL
jgi:predicted naringenin-chalcone synthase